MSQKTGSFWVTIPLGTHATKLSLTLNHTSQSTQINSPALTSRGQPLPGGEEGLRTPLRAHGGLRSSYLPLCEAAVASEVGLRSQAECESWL